MPDRPFSPLPPDDAECPPLMDNPRPPMVTGEEALEELVTMGREDHLLILRRWQAQHAQLLIWQAQRAQSDIRLGDRLSRRARFMNEVSGLIFVLAMFWSILKFNICTGLQRERAVTALLAAKELNAQHAESSKSDKPKRWDPKQGYLRTSTMDDVKKYFDRVAVTNPNRLSGNDRCKAIESIQEVGDSREPVNSCEDGILSGTDMSQTLELDSLKSDNDGLSDNEGLSSGSSAMYAFGSNEEIYGRAAVRKRRAIDEDDLINKLAPTIRQEVEHALNSTLLPLVSVLRRREEDEQSHREHMLALEVEKLALKREKLLLKRRRVALSHRNPRPRYKKRRHALGANASSRLEG